MRMTSFLIMILLSIIFLLMGCSNQNKLSEIPMEKDNPDAFYCDSDEECILQTTNCNNCGCPKAINKVYHVKIDCSEYINEDSAQCNVYCFPSKPKCIDNSCVAVT